MPPPIHLQHLDLDPTPTLEALAAKPSSLASPLPILSSPFRPPFFAPYTGHGFSRMWHHHHHGGPSRLVWFVLGAVSTAWFMKSREADGFHVKHCMRHRIPQDAYPSPAQAQQTTQQQQQMQTWEQRRREWWGWPQAQAGVAPAVAHPDPASAAAVAATAPAVPSAPAAPLPSSPSSPLPLPLPHTQSLDNWEEEKQRLQKLSQQATETVSTSYTTNVAGPVS